MEFRWVAFITVWTMLVGPVLDMPFGSPKANPSRVQSKAPVRSGQTSSNPAHPVGLAERAN
jgi:hypothetical protein